MNTDALKSYKLWIAVAAAIAGVLLSQGVLVDGSMIAQVVGWLLTFIGSGAGGAVVSKPAEPAPTEPTV